MYKFSKQLLKNKKYLDLSSSIYRAFYHLHGNTCSQTYLVSNQGHLMGVGRRHIIITDACNVNANYKVLFSSFNTFHSYSVSFLHTNLHYLKCKLFFLVSLFCFCGRPTVVSVTFLLYSRNDYFNIWI